MEIKIRSNQSNIIYVSKIKDSLNDDKVLLLSHPEFHKENFDFIIKVLLLKFY